MSIDQSTISTLLAVVSLLTTIVALVVVFVKYGAKVDQLTEIMTKVDDRLKNLETANVDLRLRETEVLTRHTIKIENLSCEMIELQKMVTILRSEVDMLKANIKANQ